MDKENKQTTHFTQSALYGKWQEAMNHKVETFSLADEANKLTWQSIRYPLFLKKCYWYIPHGPIITGQLTDKLIKDFHTKGEELLKNTHGVFLRFDPLPRQENFIKLCEKYFCLAPLSSYKSSFVQPPHDWIVDLRQTEEELLKSMHKNTRASIRLAEQRKEIIVDKISGPEISNYFKEFYDLMKETASRNNFCLHPKKYYLAIWQTAQAGKEINLFMAKDNDKILAMHLIFFFGDTAYHPFGASATLGREKMPTQILHWKAMLEAKKLGYVWYNFGAIEDPENQSKHKWTNLSKYKQKFGGKILYYSPLFDLVDQPFWYFFYNLRKKFKK